MASRQIIITSPSLNPEENVSGVSEVVRFIIQNNTTRQYLHFTIGKKDGEGGGLLQRIGRIRKTYREWKAFLKEHPVALVHYSFPLDAKSVVRDIFFIGHTYKQRRKMVVHIHGGLYLTKKNRPWVINRLMQRIFSWDIPFVVLSGRENEIVQREFGARRVEVLPNCVNLTDAESFSRVYKKGGEPLTIGYLGRIEVNKGMGWLLLACERLRREGVRFRLVMAGKEEPGSNYLENFSNQLGESFHYAGVVSGTAKVAFLRSLDVFILPTYFEGLPMSLLETMSYGAVPVTTPVGSIPEVVKDGENGLFIKVKDEQSIADALRRLNDDRVLAQKLSEQARKTIFEQFSPKSYTDKLNALYDD